MTVVMLLNSILQSSVVPVTTKPKSVKRNYSLRKGKCIAKTKTHEKTLKEPIINRRMLLKSICLSNLLKFFY